MNKFDAVRNFIKSYEDEVPYDKVTMRDMHVLMDFATEFEADPTTTGMKFADKNPYPITFGELVLLSEFATWLRENKVTL